MIFAKTGAIGQPTILSLSLSFFGVRVVSPSRTFVLSLSGSVQC